MSHPNPNQYLPNTLPDKVLNLFGQDSVADSEDAELRCAEAAAASESIYSDLIWSLTQLRYDFDDAEYHWNALLAHKKKLNEKLGRNVGIRVAAVDYFSNIVGALENPRVVDPSLLDRLYRDAVVDPLTQLPNRRAYSMRLQEELSRSARYHFPFVIAIFDVDNFKQINDEYGHSTGDRILQMIAQSLRESVRKSDFPARWGGEEFVVLMPQTHKSGGIVFAERVRARVEADLAKHKVTISGGLAAYPEDGDTEKALFAFADRALYRAKAEGKNRICMTAHERRAYPRLDQELPVIITPLPAMDPRVNTQTSNVAVGGVAVRYHEARPISAQVQGQIFANDQTATFIGRVVFVEELGSEGYELGIEFVEIDHQQWELIMANVC